ncbi:type II toxin-antitoxin system PemK/MazF family toxin [Clostridium sardiniense]|uniref:Type II toxin-antitoxin system PemK/MazF family toxin n=1 Tax=Clostridium sardiniense TaxID=29369 RepID=A0ABS7L2D1_CLOSR|nr:type II toxin-antitoxin system PemK/MazF family toxin [Clostridium sardiniense]MDQ0461635.1 mRNA-degrading endonuclease toxin of MazEF toxin-antitoxin module [Clostridium sardiniense]
MRCKRGDVFWCNIDNSIGSEQDGTRPVVIIQNDISLDLIEKERVHSI